jgi:excisionase family DNA binding protein
MEPRGAASHPVVIDPSPALAGFLAIALHDMRKRALIDELPIPRGTSDLERMFTQRATPGHDGPPVDGPGCGLHSRVYGNRTPQLLEDLAGAAAALKLSERTVKRLVASGELRSIHVGKALRFVVSDLQDFVDRLQ